MRQAVNRRAAQLTKLCIKLNSDDFTVFCEFQGHINTIQIRVYLGGWVEYTNADWNRYIDLTSVRSLELLEQAIERLQVIKDAGSI